MISTYKEYKKSSYFTLYMIYTHTKVLVAYIYRKEDMLMNHIQSF